MMVQVKLKFLAHGFLRLWSILTDCAMLVGVEDKELLQRSMLKH